MLFARFLKDRKAGVAPMLALSIIPIMGAVGTAVDYSRAPINFGFDQASRGSFSSYLGKAPSIRIGTW